MFPVMSTCAKIHRNAVREFYIKLRAYSRLKMIDTRENSILYANAGPQLIVSTRRIKYKFVRSTKVSIIPNSYCLDGGNH